MGEAERPSWSWDRECAKPGCAREGEHWHNGYRFWGRPLTEDDAAYWLGNLDEEDHDG